MPRFTTLESRLAPLPIDNVDTDQITPAGFLKLTERSDLGEFLFYHWRHNEDGSLKEDFPLNRPEYQGAEVLLAGDNFGCGSSREHAAWALLDFGFKAVISTRFADIFRNNSLKNGLLAVTVSPATYERLLDAVHDDPSNTIRIDLAPQQITLPNGEVVDFAIDPFAKHCLLNGVDQLGYLVEQVPEIEAYESHHPPRLNTLG